MKKAIHMILMTFSLFYIGALCGIEFFSTIGMYGANTGTIMELMGCICLAYVITFWTINK